jgi:hypothetical protein
MVQERVNIDALPKIIDDKVSVRKALQSLNQQYLPQNV